MITEYTGFVRRGQDEETGVKKAERGLLQVPVF
jgi:hypothetical protein